GPCCRESWPYPGQGDPGYHIRWLTARPRDDLTSWPHAMNTSVAAFVETLLASRVLDPAQRDEFAREGLARLGDLGALTDELLRRGWLTRFQLTEMEKGRGKELVCGQYLLLEGLGEGGMGRVFKARHRRMRRVVALKVIHKDLVADPRAVLRF